VIDSAAVAKIKADGYKQLGMLGYVLQDEIREEQIVPRDTGNLQNEAFTVDTSNQSGGVVTLRFTAPYARRLYFHPEYHFNREKNPNAQGEWLTPWMEGGKYEKRPSEILEGLLKRGL
jgi:hypothetical protein